SYLLISCSQAAFKAANDEPTTTTIPKVKAPTFSVESGTKFKSSILVDINCSTRDAVIRYSYDNVNWVIGTILLISETKTVYAKATKDGMIDSDVVSAIYICTNAATSTTTSSIQDVSTTLPSTTTTTSVKTSTTIDAYASTTTTTTIPKVKAPTFSVESGTKFKSPVLVDINCSTRDAVIRYSYDNVNWVIGTILLISETKTVYAKATKDGMIDSDVVSAIYICTAVSTTSTSTSTTIASTTTTSTSTSTTIAPTTTTSTTTTTTIAPTTSTSVASMTTSTSTTIAPLYEVTFNSDGGSFVNSQTINYGGKVTQPIDPTKTNYIFSGWYKESTLINLWNFDSDTITTDTILYAGWMLDSNPALWAKSVTAGNDYSYFNSVAVDSSGNVYAAGYQSRTGSFTYGPGVSVAGSGSSNVVLVKYNSSGNALWAKSVTAGTSESRFNSVAVDSSGNVYAAGYQRGTGSFTYGPGVSVAGSGS
ncbi:MAG TPA: InlB B-repeat-containing protein, partial [Spirochaetota bacterium]|nr:InlB B-repeat-containing protein [Spirochaetota bacterium]